MSHQKIFFDLKSMSGSKHKHACFNNEGENQQPIKLDNQFSLSHPDLSDNNSDDSHGHSIDIDGYLENFRNKLEDQQKQSINPFCIEENDNQYGIKTEEDQNENDNSFEQFN